MYVFENEYFLRSQGFMKSCESQPNAQLWKIKLWNSIPTLFDAHFIPFYQQGFVLRTSSGSVRLPWLFRDNFKENQPKLGKYVESFPVQEFF